MVDHRHGSAGRLYSSAAHWMVYSSVSTGMGSEIQRVAAPIRGGLHCGQGSGFVSSELAEQLAVARQLASSVLARNEFFHFVQRFESSDSMRIQLS